MGGLSEKDFYTKSKTIKIRKKVNEEVCISRNTNSSIGTKFKVLETNYKNFLKEEEINDEYLGAPGMCGCYTNNSMTFKCLKPGTAIIKLQWYYRGRKEGVETYKIVITK